MRIDASNARTVLVAAIGGWALVFAALSLAGLGSRIGTLEDDGSGVVPVGPGAAELPSAPSLTAFDEIAARPLFTGDRRPHPFFIDPQAEGDGDGFDYVLTSVLRAPGFTLAILQPSGGGDSVRLKIGEAPPAASNWRLESVDTRSAVFSTPEGPRTLELRVYDGTGGDPPTPMTAVPSPDGRAPAQAASRPPRAAQQAANAAATGDRAATATAQPPESERALTSSAGRVRPEAAAASGNGTAEATPATGPSEAQVEAIRRRIEERRARLRQQQQQQSTPAPTP